MREYVINGQRNGLNIGRKVGACPESRRQWVLGSVHAFSQDVYAANAYRPRLQVRARPSYSGNAFCAFGSVEVKVSSRKSPPISGPRALLRQNSLRGGNKKSTVATHSVLLGVSRSWSVVDSRLPHPVALEQPVPCALAFTRYSFTLRLLCTNQSSFFCPLPLALPTLLQCYCMAIAQ